MSRHFAKSKRIHFYFYISGGNIKAYILRDWGNIEQCKERKYLLLYIIECYLL